MKILRIAALGVSLIATANSLHAATEADAPAPAPKVAPLLMLALSTVGNEALSAAREEGMFTRLYKSIFGSSAKDADKGKPAAQSAPAAGALEGRIIPSVAYSLEQLNPETFALIKMHRLDGDVPALKTGDVFALHYSTNLPGLVRLENIDSTGLVSALGTYTVLPDQDNRIPTSKGIALTGATGNELIKVLFYPCVPRELAGKPAEAAFRGRLPACDATAASQISAAAKGSIKTKALVNLAQPDPLVSFSGTSDYQPQDVTSTTLTVRHEKP